MLVAKYALRRILAAVLVLVMMSFVAFMLINIAPGNALLAQIAGSGAIGGTLDADVLKLFEQELGLDKPILERYANWLFNAVQGDLGRSFVNDQSVLDRIGERLPTSIELVVIASIVSFAIAVPIGVISAARQGGVWDYASRTFAILGLAIPNFFLAIIVLIIFSRWLDISLSTMAKPDLWKDPIQNLQGVIVPALIVGFTLIATVMRMARSATLEVLNEDYVRTARAKGLVERVVISRHVVRNALIPVITIFGNQFAFILGGTVIVEQIFRVPGIGFLALDSIQKRDYPLVMGVTLVLGFVVVTTNLLVDLSYGAIDPRIRYS
jgi:peptide/nickel transport system permease protein